MFHILVLLRHVYFSRKVAWAKSRHLLRQQGSRGMWLSLIKSVAWHFGVCVRLLQSVGQPCHMTTAGWSMKSGHRFAGSFHLCVISLGNLPYVQAVLCGMHIWFERVSTDDNISDLPSREEYKLLEDLGAIWVPPMIAKLYTSGLSWRMRCICHCISSFIQQVLWRNTACLLSTWSLTHI